MKPETRTVTQLFGLDVRYVVTLYRRPCGLAPRPFDLPRRVADRPRGGSTLQEVADV